MKESFHRIADILSPRRMLDHAPEAIAGSMGFLWIPVLVVWGFLKGGSCWRFLLFVLVILSAVAGSYWIWFRPDVTGVLSSADVNDGRCTDIPVACIFKGDSCSQQVECTNDMGEFSFKRWYGSYAYLLAIDVDRNRQTAGLTEYLVEGFNSRRHVNLVFPARKVDVRVMDTVYFNNKGFSLLVENGSYVILERTLRLLQENPDMDLVLGGHASRSGDAKPNLNLSRARLDGVFRWYCGQGIDAKRIICLNYGEDHPINKNDSEEDSESPAARQNRAVTQVLIPRSRQYRKFLSICDGSMDPSDGVNPFRRTGMCHYWRQDGAFLVEGGYPKVVFPWLVDHYRTRHHDLQESVELTRLLALGWARDGTGAPRINPSNTTYPSVRRIELSDGRL